MPVHCCGEFESVRIRSLRVSRRATSRRRIDRVLNLSIAVGLSIAAAPSFAADARNVTVVNETGYAIKFLGFNAPDDGMDEWDNELDKVLQNQASTYVEFDDDDDGCVWNIRVDWQNYDETVLWKNVNLCKFTALRLRYDSGTKTTSFVAE